MPSLIEILDCPSKVDQMAGYCGFAAVLMAVLERRDAVLVELLQCLEDGIQFREILISINIKERIERRLAVEVLDKQEEDWVLCITIMILFKESSKQAQDGLWAACVEYSNLFEKWQYSSAMSKDQKPLNKFKEMKFERKLKFPGLSYKKGDLAVPPSAMPAVLRLLDVDVDYTMDVNHDNERAGQQGVQQVECVVFNNSITKKMNQMQQEMTHDADRIPGVVLGVGPDSDPRFNQYSNVAHWIYVPSSPKKRSANDCDFKVWTYGREQSFWEEFNQKYKWFPAYALFLK